MPSELYDLEIEKAVEKIRKHNARFVCIQLPDGLKRYAPEIMESIRNEIPEIKIVLWGGSCYGACDLPIEVKRLGVDLLIQWGHSPWVY
ncbi:MAG: diphthamide synthesis protein [Candidatus Woesearchaeota archaeon]